MELDLWNPQELLPAVSPSEVRFSRGFLAVDLPQLFEKLPSKWEAFFTKIGMNIQIVSTSQALKPPAGGSVASFEFELMGGSAVLYLMPSIFDGIEEVGLGEVSNVGKRVFVEYLFRRFLASLNSCCKLKQFRAMFRSGDGDRINANSSIELKLQIQGKSTTVWLGLGQDALENVDQLLRDYVRTTGSAKASSGGSLATVSMEICQLAVPPANLIDYIRPGTVIDLQRPVGRDIQLIRDGELWLEGELVNCQGLYVARVTDVAPRRSEVAAGTSKLSIELANFEMDAPACRESELMGALINSAQSLTSNVSLKVNGESIAKAQLAVADEHFVIKVGA